VVRWGFLAVAVGLASPWRPEAWGWTSVVLPSLSPFVVIGGAVAARSLTRFALLALPILLLAWWVPRVICGYGCPVGLLQELVARLRRCPRRPWLRFPLLGTWLAMATLAGAALGYPLFLWLDPLAIFNSGLNAWRGPLTAVNLIAGLGLAGLLLLELLLPQFWCRRVCPLGAVQDFLTQSRRWMARPPGTATPMVKPSGAAPLSRGRRAFFAAGVGATGALAVRILRGQSPGPLRPPGSLDEARFPGVCVRCGNCAQACPPHIIQPDFASGLAGLLAPRLSFAEGFCREDCHRCLQVCPSGAITRLSLPEKRRAVIGSAQVDLDTCLMALGRECNACVQHCPYEAVAVASGADGFSSRPQVDLAHCNGCGACETACPVRPRRAIRVTATERARLLPGTKEIEVSRRAPTGVWATCGRNYG
jgi:ferredoxin-type protein NapF